VEQVQEHTSRKDTARLLVVLALVLAALAYVNTLRFAFVYDDLPQIVNNPRVHSWAHAPRLFTEHVWSQFSGQPGNYYRPLFELWLLINYSLFAFRPLGYHLTTVAVHLLVTALAYLLLKRVTGDRLTAAIATVIFALHPTHVETVAWISGVTDALVAVFVLLSVLAYARWRDTGQKPVPHKSWWLVAAVACYGIAMLGKETAVLTPAVLLAYDWWVIGGEDRKLRLGNLARRYWPFAATAAVYMVVRQAVLGAVAYPESYPLKNILLTLPTFLWFYVHDLIWPVGLSVFHDVPLVQSPGLTNFVLPLLGAGAVIGAMIWAARRSRTAAFGAFWIFVFMVPPIVGVYSFIAEDLVHDRYLYLPSIGFALLIAQAIRWLPQAGELFGAPAAQMGATLALAGALAAGTALQNVYWTNDLILYAHAMQSAPRNVIAINHLANEFYKRGKPQQALELYAQSLQIKPHYWATHFALGITEFELGKFQDAAGNLEAAIPLLPGNADQYYYLGLVRIELGRFADAEAALRRGLALFPRRAGLNYALGMALEKQGKTAEAADAYRAELANDPGSALARQALQRLAASSR
jgi:tetratricopeptide (TPR) repeat protein